MLAADENAKVRLQGRRFWPSYIWEGSRVLPDLGEVVMLKQHVAVTEAEIDAMMEVAEVELDRHEAELQAKREAQQRAEEEAEAAEAAKRAELATMDPAPAVLQMGDLLLFRWVDGCWYDEREAENADPVYQFDDLAEVLEWAEAEGALLRGSWLTLEACDAALADDADAEEPVDQAA